MPGNPLSDPNWAPQLADTVERFVGTIRQKTTDNVIKVVRALVFGTIVLLAVPALLVLLTVFGTRLLMAVVSRVSRTDHDSTVWITYAVLAALLYLAGAVLMRKRHAKDAA